MFEPVTALRHAQSSSGIAEIREIGPLGMITLRGDLADPKIIRAATLVAAVDYPATRRCNCERDQGIAWMSPDELLVMCAYAAVPEAVKTMQETVSGSHAMVANVSDARAVFQVSGPNAREVLAKLAPVDLSPTHFTPGMFRRSRLAQVPAAFWMRDDATFQIICFRSVAQYVFDLLKVAAQPGSKVGHF